MAIPVKEMPKGTFLHFQYLPLGTTEIELSKFLERHGFDVPPARISIKKYEHQGRLSALISLPREAVAALVNEKISDSVFNGDSLLVCEAWGIACPKSLRPTRAPLTPDWMSNAAQ